uniref:Telomerase reverse transcriptase n=1 Tax=Angiostrongylus cantonensis TaxID=6313 RepID=A0A158P5Q7_ANGCA
MKGRNEMNMLSACLDGHIEVMGFKPLGGLLLEVKRLKRFLKCHELRKQIQGRVGRLYFAKADISNCYASVDRGILRKALQMLIGDRMMYVVYGYGKFSKMANVCVHRAGPTYDTAVKSLLKAMKQKKLKDVTAIPVRTEVIEGPQLVETVMSLLEGIRLSLDNSGTLYTMGKGVPPGFILSPRLAHIYVLYFEHTVWKRLSRRTCMLRYVDDYLVCSYIRSEVEKILTALHTPNAFGISARESKCQVCFIRSVMIT